MDSSGKPLELNFCFLRKSILSLMEERKIDFIFNIGMSEKGPQYLISSNMVSKIKSARKKEISLQMDHSRNVKSPRKPSVCVCWLGIREALTQAPGMVNGDEAIAKHGLTATDSVCGCAVAQLLVVYLSWQLSPTLGGQVFRLESG